MSQPRPTTAGASFSVDLDRAPQAIRDLEDARDQLKHLLKDAHALGSVRPPAADQVSADAAKALSNVAVGGPGSLVVALEAGIKQLSELAQSMRDELESYRKSDVGAEQSFRRPSID